jgi:hypothetical protein
MASLDAFFRRGADGLGRVKEEGLGSGREEGRMGEQMTVESASSFKIS